MPEREVSRVTFLVPNYNGRTLLDVLLPSILAQRYTDYAVLIVDDASTDDSVAYVGERWPTVELLRLSTNHGFAAAVNAGLSRVRSEYVAIVNTDVELDPGWLDALVDTLDHHPEAGSATGKTLVYSRREVLDGAGNLMRWSGDATRRGYGELDRGQFDQPGEVISACAGYALFRRSAFELVGPFDEQLIAYYEDVDWGLRAQLAGLGCRYEPGAIAFHVGGASHGADPRYERLLRRNHLLVVLKNYPARSFARHAPALILGLLLVFARAIHADGMRSVRIQLLAIGDAVRLAPRVWRARTPPPLGSHAADARLDALMAPYDVRRALARCFR
jgi:GT2 family glycosyltransferase